MRSIGEAASCFVKAVSLVIPASVGLATGNGFDHMAKHLSIIFVVRD